MTHVEEVYTMATTAWKRGRRVGFLEGLIAGLLLAGAAALVVLR